MRRQASHIGRSPLISNQPSAISSMRLRALAMPVVMVRLAVQRQCR